MSTQASYSCLMRGYSILKYALQPKNCSDLGMSYLYKNLQVSLQRLELGFFKLGLAQSREDPPGLTKCLGLLKIGLLEVLYKLFEF